MDNQGIKKLESDLWESADFLRAGSKLTGQQYACRCWACYFFDTPIAGSRR